MSYFANFQRCGGALFRLDTRIYLNDHDAPSKHDVRIAAVVAKNPGSAKPRALGRLAPLTLAGDKMLPSVRNRFRAAYSTAKKVSPQGAYVQVWNLFYLCTPNL